MNIFIKVCGIFSLLVLSLSPFVLGDTECPVVVAGGGSGDRRTNKDVLRIVQYNAEWLFIDYYAASDCPGDGCSWANQTSAEMHMKTVASLIAELDPDILNICEVEGCDELVMLTDMLVGSATYIPYLKKGTDSSTGQNVGMLTKIDPLISLYRTEERANYPIEGSLCGYSGAAGTSGVSKHYITEFTLDAGETMIAFIAAHLLAFPTDSVRCAEREAQAMVLQSVISGYIERGYEIIFLGDLNDFDGVVLDAKKDIPTSKVLDILKGNWGNKGTEYQLYSVAETIPQEERYSDWYDENSDCVAVVPAEFSMIDHILVSEALRERVVDSYIYHGYKEYCGTYNSDHFPIVIEIV